MNEVVPSRWPGFVLVASLGFNCLLVGLIAGHGWSTGSLKPQPVQVSGFGQRIQSLSREDKRAFVLHMLPARKGIKAARDELKEARQAVADAITHEPYDANAVAAAFATLRGKSAAVQEAVQEAASKALASVSADGRRKLVK